MSAHADQKEHVRALFDLVAFDYDEAGVDFFQVLGRRLVEIAEIRPGQRVLDVGTGRGAVLFPAAEVVGPGGAVDGIDLSPAMIDLLREEIDRRGVTNATARVGDAEAPGVPDSSFDVVVASLVLPFLTDLRRALEAFRAALRPGGALGFTTFGDPDLRWEPLERLLVQAGGGEDDDRGGVDDDPLGSPAAIGDTLEASGFADVDVLDEIHRTIFPSPERWFAWTNGTSGRALFDRIPPRRREETLADAMALVETLRGDDGLIAHDVTVRYTVARRP